MHILYSRYTVMHFSPFDRQRNKAESERCTGRPAAAPRDTCPRHALCPSTFMPPHSTTVNPRRSRGTAGSWPSPQQLACGSLAPLNSMKQRISVSGGGDTVRAASLEYSASSRKWMTLYAFAYAEQSPQLFSRHTARSSSPRQHRDHLQLRKPVRYHACPLPRREPQQ